jgi:arylsulfatase A-like enzyme/lipopolysaccharide biosynthesis regulator YciM
VVVISIDTLRSDRLPAYGYSATETPAIDALQQDGILFERAFSHYPITLPSHVSIFTGLLPTEHGVRDNVGYRLDANQVPFLPRLLKKRGYRTGAAVSVYILRRDTGLGDSFDFYEDSIGLKREASLGESQRSGTETLSSAKEWLGSVAGEPFLFFFHIYEPHTPWTAPEPFASSYDEPYDGEVAAADAVVGELLAELRRLGVYDQAIVVLLSDHGEGLGDHGELEHGILLYREVLQVPLLLKLPGSHLAGLRVAAPAQLIDIYPTIARLVGERGIDGVTLLELLQDDRPVRPIYSETYYPRLHLGWSQLASLIAGDLHYIEGPDPELYDLEADPGETTNRLRERRRDHGALRRRLAEYRRELEAPSGVDSETARRLAALGYLSTRAPADSGPLKDPKSQLHVLDDLMAAFRAQARRDFVAAATAFQQVVADNPDMADAWENLAQCLHQLGRFPEAVAAFERAMELSRGADHVALGAARVFIDIGDLSQARAHAELSLETNPAAAHRVLARIALADQDLEQAEVHARAALAERPNAIQSLIILAQVAAEKADLDEARELVARAEQAQAKQRADQTPLGLHFTKGDILARLGEAGEAARAFRQEIEQHPGDTRAYARLALLYALEGRTKEAVAILQRMVEENQKPSAYAAAAETLRVLGDPRSADALLGHALRRFPDNAKLKQLVEKAG